jgi:hypothetical protein
MYVMSNFVQWFFDGLGTMLLGLFIGAGTVGSVWFVRSKSITKQTQKAGDNARQLQIGRDVRR